MQQTIDSNIAANELLQFWREIGVEIPIEITQKPKVRAKPSIEAAPKPLNISGYKKPVDAHTDAINIAAQVKNIAELHDAIESFEGISLKKGATKMVFCDGQVDAKIMVIGEAPGREEDLAGKPFIGAIGQFFDKMLNSIGLARETNLYMTNCVNWRTPGNRPPTRDEMALSLPFIKCHIALFAPKLILIVGEKAAHVLLDSKLGIAKLRGKVHFLAVDGQHEKIPCFAILHPEHLLSRPSEKSVAWKDLLSIQAHIKDMPKN